MLIYYFVHVHGTVDQAAQALTDSSGNLKVWAQLAYEGGEELRARIEPVGWLPAKEVEITLGTPRMRLGTVTIPMVWKATGPEVLFPMLEGDLIVEAVGVDLTQITLRGSYKPPLGRLGELLDRALLHRLAEACVKNFMDRIQAALVPAHNTSIG